MSNEKVFTDVENVILNYMNGRSDFIFHDISQVDYNPLVNEFNVTVRCKFKNESIMEILSNCKNEQEKADYLRFFADYFVFISKVKNGEVISFEMKDAVFSS